MQRFRLSTLMLLIVIVGMAAALLVQHQRAAQREADLRAAFAENRQFLARTEQLIADKQQLLRDLNRAVADSKKHRERSNKIAEMMTGPTGPTAMWLEGWSTFGIDSPDNGASGWRKELRDNAIRSWRQAFDAYLDAGVPEDSPSTEACREVVRGA